jgi:hypothetical protein
MPDHAWFDAGAAQGNRHVTLTVGAGENDDPGLHAPAAWLVPVVTP